MTADPFHQYMFAEHDQATLQRWANQLSFFRFCRAYGGHANDGDQFLVVLRYLNEQEYRSILGTLGLKPKELSSDDQQLTPGQSYPASEIQDHKFAIKDLSHLEQIGWCEINDCRCHVRASLGRLSISVAGASGDAYRVSELDFEHAKSIETNLGDLREFVIDPPRDDRNCICPWYYAGFFKGDA